LSICWGGGWTGGGETTFLGESKTGNVDSLAAAVDLGVGVEGGVMKTVYGPILPIMGGGVEGSLLIGIFLFLKLERREMRGKQRKGKGFAFWRRRIRRRRVKNEWEKTKEAGVQDPRGFGWQGERIYNCETVHTAQVVRSLSLLG